MGLRRHAEKLYLARRSAHEGLLISETRTCWSFMGQLTLNRDEKLNTNTWGLSLLTSESKKDILKVTKGSVLMIT